MDGPIIGSDLSKESAINSWIQIPYEKIQHSKELTIVIYDKEKSIAYEKYPRKHMFRVELNVFREEIHLDRKKFVNLVELICYVGILIAFIALYKPYIHQFLDFLRS